MRKSVTITNRAGKFILTAESKYITRESFDFIFTRENSINEICQIITDKFPRLISTLELVTEICTMLINGEMIVGLNHSPE